MPLDDIDLLRDNRSGCFFGETTLAEALVPLDEALRQLLREGEQSDRQRSEVLLGCRVWGPIPQRKLAAHKVFPQQQNPARNCLIAHGHILGESARRDRLRETGPGC